MKTLYLASQSASRKKILEEVQIPFQVITQNADEGQCDWNQPLDTVVLSIARYKMQGLIMPEGHKVGDKVYVLTGDSLTQDKQGTIHGKPTSLDDARSMLDAIQGVSTTATAFCLEVREYTASGWQTIAQKEGIVRGSCELAMPQQWYDEYFSHINVLKVAGALSMEGYCMQFIKTITGSYTAILGLPIFEVRQALQDLAFFEKE